MAGAPAHRRFRVPGYILSGTLALGSCEATQSVTFYQDGPKIAREGERTVPKYDHFVKVMVMVGFNPPQCLRTLLASKLIANAGRAQRSAHVADIGV